MVSINDYREEKSCVYKGEEYLVRDNGAVMRKPRPNQKPRKYDNIWTFGEKNITNGYSFFFGTGHRIHQIVATAFHGASPAPKEYVVDHIDTNRQNNRADNLRWITKEENVLANEVTRKKIEYCTGVSAEEFIQNPAQYRERFPKSNVSHMRPVNQHEASAYSRNIQKLAMRKGPSGYHNNAKLEDWIYKSRDLTPIDEIIKGGEEQVTRPARQI